MRFFDRNRFCIQSSEMGTPWEFWRWAEGGEVKEHVWWWPMWSYMLLGRVSLRSWQHPRPTSLKVQTNFGAQSCLSGLRHKAAALLTEEKRDLTQNARAYVRHHFSFDLSFLQSPVSVLFFFSRIEIESSKSERRKKTGFLFYKRLLYRFSVTDLHRRKRRALFLWPHYYEFMITATLSSFSFSLALHTYFKG
jgi:hypothetical protein